MPFKALRVAAVLALCLPLPALAGVGVDVEILDRKTGRVLPVYWHDGVRHVAGEPGREYEIRLRNHAGGRVLAVTSVDGVNVITGGTASPAQSGYVLDPWGFLEIECRAEIELVPEPDEETLRELLQQAERGCFIGGSLRPEPVYAWTLNGREVDR